MVRGKKKSALGVAFASLVASRLAIIGICLFPTMLIGATGTKVSASKTRVVKNSNAATRKPSQSIKRAPLGQTPSRPARSNSKETKKLSARDLYLKARDFFAAGRYPEAIQYAAAAQRRIQTSNAPTVLVAQSYYRIGNVARAAKLFLSMPLSDIPREAAVDYELTMFAARRYKEVIKGFALVPESHPYKDIIRFYVGVSYMQFRLYQKAQVALRNSRKLTASLRVQRRQILSEINQIIDRERRGLSEQAQAYSYQTQQIYVPPPPEIPMAPKPILPGGVPGAAAPKPTPPPAPKSGVSGSAKTVLGAQGKLKRRDFHGRNLEQTDESSYSASLGLSLKYLGAPRSFGAQPSIDANFTPSYANTDSKTSSSALQANTQDTDNVQNLSTRSEPASYKIDQTYGISGTYPFSDPIDIGGGYSVENTLSRSSKKSESSVTTQNLSLKGDFDAFDLDAGWKSEVSADKSAPSAKSESTTTTLGLTRNGENSTVSLGLTMLANNQPALTSGIKSSMDLDLSWLRNMDDFSVSLSANKSDKIREPLSAAKTVLNQMSLKLEGSYSMSFGLSATASGTFYQLSNLVVLNGGAVTDGPDEVMASGDAKQVKVSVKVSPVSFASASISYDYTDRALSVGDPNFKLKMMKENWSQDTVSTINLSFNYSF
jgi:tetratricopeptide (TPR) repeat protein